MGAEHAKAIVKNGGKVVIADILESEGRKLVSNLGESAVFVKLDVTSIDGWDNAVRVTIESFGKLNVLINNAGIINGGFIEDYTEDDWNRILDINLSGAFRGVKSAIAELKKNAPSSIINISSTAGIKGFAGASGYCAAKFAVRGLTKSFALEFAESNVRVNSVHPGNIETKLIEGIYPSFNHVPMQRCGQIEEVSSLIVYLASDESSFSTGAEFVIDGGETAGQIIGLGDS